jgi:protein-glutamine gamma-glutamyltransferase
MAEASPAIDPASRAWTLAATVACVLPLLLQLPSRIALGVGIVGMLSGAASWRIRVPGWLRLLLSLALVAIVMSAMGMRIGRDTGCALLAAMLAIKPLELHTVRDARSLLGFALFAPFATFLLDQGPWSLLLGLAGALLALLALLRLSEQESGDARPPSTRGRVGIVLRLVATGLPLALAAFWLFPRIATPLWGVPQRAIATPGLSDTMSPGDWLDLMNDDSPALRAVFFGETPDVTQMYWRGPVLTDFDGREWTRSRWLRHLPPAALAHDERIIWDYQVDIEPTDQHWLVALEMPRAIPGGTRSSWEHSLAAERPLHSVTRWRMQSSPVRRFEPDLPTYIRQNALQLPEGFNPRTVALAREWRRQAGEGGDRRIVERAMRMIRDEFGYTLSTPLPGRHTADEFLFDWKQGFCEHFSSAFVVLMRAAGIPARVVTGYAGGYRNSFGDYWVVRRSDAHAWAEVWLQGEGWVRVDPTAAVAPERIYDTLADRARGNVLGGLPGLVSALDLGDWLRRGWNDLVLGFDASRQRDLLQRLGGGPLGPRGLIALFASAAALALAWMLWLSARGARERDPLLRAWHRLGRRYARLGLGRARHEPALDWVERIAPSLDAATAAALSVLSHRFVEWRYAADAGRAAAPDLIRALHRHRPARADLPECPP